MIPQRDVRFVQQKAFKLLSEDKTIDDIKQLIASEGGNNDQIQKLSAKYLDDYAFLRKEVQKRSQKSASSYQLIGSVLLISGLTLVAISYFSMEGRGVFIFWSILIAGVLFWSRGVILRRQR